MTGAALASLVICTHNGALRFRTAFAQRKSQEPLKIPWDAFVIDNALTEGSAEVSWAPWRNKPAPFRDVNDAFLGVPYARERGVVEATYDALGLVDEVNLGASGLST